MTVCIKCGKESESILCGACRETTDIERLCVEILAYRPGCGENPVWDAAAAGLSHAGNFKSVVFALSDRLLPPKREYMKVLSIIGDGANVQKKSRPWFYEIYDKNKDAAGLSSFEINRLRGVALGAYYMDYEYEKAEETAKLLCGAADVPPQAYLNLAEFYMTTRRYDEAARIIAEARARFRDDSEKAGAFNYLEKKNRDRMEKAATGKGEYMPNPKENAAKVQARYIAFISSLGIEAKPPVQKSARPKPIPREDYPDPTETRDCGFDTFVAFDVETTGFDPKKDSIIEIGAVRVINGVVPESGENVFQSFTKTIDRKKLSEYVQELTGITPDDLKDAREVWDVFKDFMDFADGCVLVGFNCISFDSRFLVRAGRYAHIEMKNAFFDVMSYAEKFKRELGIKTPKVSLETLADALSVENPQAHRALSDAVTTAKAFLKLKEMDNPDMPGGLDDMIADIESWDD
ncbi:MAG: 3'-5' exonuclease [Clostridia bacterium]|nr:3'-5' exonuclease [Clostridia bacterium]